MGTLMVQQPNGLYALFSTISDGFTYLDCTEDDCKEIFFQSDFYKIQNYKKQIERGSLDEAELIDTKHLIDLLERTVQAQWDNLMLRTRSRWSKPREDFNHYITEHARRHGADDANSILVSLGLPVRFDPATFKMYHEMTDEELDNL